MGERNGRYWLSLLAWLILFVSWALLYFERNNLRADILQHRLDWNEDMKTGEPECLCVWLDGKRNCSKLIKGLKP